MRLLQQISAQELAHLDERIDHSADSRCPPNAKEACCALLRFWIERMYLPTEGLERPQCQSAETWLTGSLGEGREKQSHSATPVIETIAQHLQLEALCLRFIA